MFMNINVKNDYQKPNPERLGEIYQDKVRFIPQMQTWCNIRKSTDIIHPTNKVKKKTQDHFNRGKKFIKKIQHLSIT